MMFKPCAKCGTLVQFPARYCEDCKRAIKMYERTDTKTDKHKEVTKDKPKQKRSGDKRALYREKNRKYINFYKSKAWKVMSHKKLADARYICFDCGGLACEVHHVVPIQIDWRGRLDYNNLVVLCVKCHNRRHERFSGTQGAVGEIF